MLPRKYSWGYGVVRSLAALLARSHASETRHDCHAGYVVLNNLELKPEAIDLLQLPVTLVRGYIGRIEFQIPWGNPGTKPTVVKVDQVYIAVETKYRWSGSQAQRRRKLALKSKLERVEAHESKLVKRNRGDGDDAAEAPLEAAGLAGFLERLLTKVADNLQVHVRGVHLRWEDRVTTPTRPFAAGITLESLHLQTTDGAFRPSMVEATSGTLRTPLVFKALHINCLSVYWNPHMYLCDADGPIIVPTSDVATVLPELTVEQSGEAQELPQDLLQTATPAVTDDGRPAGAVRSVTPLELLRARDATLSSRRAAAAHSNIYPQYHIDSARESHKGRFLLPFAASEVSSMVGGASSVASATDTQGASGTHRFSQAATLGSDPWRMGSQSAFKGPHPARQSSSATGSDERRSPMDRNSSPFSATHAAATDSPKLSPFLSQARRKSSPAQSSVGSSEDELYGGMLDLRTCHLETLVSLFEGMVAKRAQNEPALDATRISDSRQPSSSGYMSGLFSGVSWLLGGGQRDAVAGADASFVSASTLPAPVSAPSKRQAAQAKPTNIGLSATDWSSGISSADCPKQCFLLAPISAELRMQLSKNPRDLRHPQQAFSLRLPSVQLRLGRDQLQSILQAGSSLSSAMLAAQLDALRPTRALKSRGPVAWMQAPEAAEHRGVIRSWFRFAARQALQRLRRRSGHLSWMQIRRLRVMRRVYVQLYKRSLAGRQAPPGSVNTAPISSAFAVWLSTVAVSAERVESTLPTPSSMGSLGGAASHLPQSSSMASLRGLAHAWDTHKHRSAVLRCWPDPAEVMEEWHGARARHVRTTSASSTPLAGQAAKSPLAMSAASGPGFKPTDLSPIASVPANSPTGAAGHRSFSASRSPFPELGSNGSPRSTIESPVESGSISMPWRASSAGRQRHEKDDSMASPSLNASLLSLHMPQSRPFSSHQLSVATGQQHSSGSHEGAKGLLSPSSSQPGGAFSPFMGGGGSNQEQLLQFPEAEAWVAMCTYLGVGAPVETYGSVEDILNSADIVAACLTIAGKSCSVLRCVSQDSSASSQHEVQSPLSPESKHFSWIKWAGEFKAASARLQQALLRSADHDPQPDIATCRADLSQLLQAETLLETPDGRYQQLHELESALLHRVEECVAEEQLLAWRRIARQQLLRESAARKLHRIPRYPTSNRTTPSGARDAIVSPRSALDGVGPASANSGEPPRKGSGTTAGTFPNTAEPAADMPDSVSVRSGSIRDQVASTWEWAFGGGKPASAGAGAESVFSGGRPDEAEEKMQMKQDMLTEAQRRELFAVIDYDPSMLALKYPKGYVQQELQLSVATCSISLLTAAHADSHHRVPVFAFQHMKVKDQCSSDASVARAFFALKLANAGCLVSIRPDSFKLQTELQSLAAWDLSGVSHRSYRSILVPTADKDQVQGNNEALSETPATMVSVPGSPRHSSVRVAPAPPSPSFTSIGKTALPTVEEVTESASPVFELTFETFGLLSSKSTSGGQPAAAAQPDRSSSSPSESSARAASDGSSSKHSQVAAADLAEGVEDDRESVNSATSSFSGVSGSAGQTDSFGILWGTGTKTRHIRVEGTTRQSTRSEATKQAGTSANLSALGWADEALHSIKKPEWALQSNAAVSCRLEPLEVLISGHVTSFLQEFCDVPLAGVSDEFELEAAARLAQWRQRTAAKLAYASAQRQITAVQATIASPVLRMVADATVAQSSELQFSAGLLHFRSIKLRQGSELLSAGSALERPQGQSTSLLVASAAPLVELSSLYDHFDLEMSGIRLSLSKPGSAAAHGGTRRQEAQVIQLLDPVNIQWSLFLCVIGADFSLPQARLHGQVSGLNIALCRADLPQLLSWVNGTREAQEMIGPASRAAAIAREVERQNLESGVGHRYAVLSAGVSEADYPEADDSGSDAPVFDDEIEEMTQQPSTVRKARAAYRKTSLDSSMVRGTASIVSRVFESQSVLSANRRTAVTRNDTFVTAHSGSLLSNGQMGGAQVSDGHQGGSAPLLSSVILPFLYSSVPLAQVVIGADFIRIKLHGQQQTEPRNGLLHESDEDIVLAEVLHVRGALNVSATESRVGLSTEAVSCQVVSAGHAHPFLWQLSKPSSRSDADKSAALPVLGGHEEACSTMRSWKELCTLFSACIASELPHQCLQVNLVAKDCPQHFSIDVQTQHIGLWMSPKLLSIFQQWSQSLTEFGPVHVSETAERQPESPVQCMGTVSFHGKGVCAVLQVSHRLALVAAAGAMTLESTDTHQENMFAQQITLAKCEWLKCLLCTEFLGPVSSQRSIAAAYFGTQSSASRPFARVLSSHGDTFKPCIGVKFQRTRQNARAEDPSSAEKDALELAYSNWLQPVDARRLASKGDVFFKQVDTDIGHLEVQLNALVISFPIDDVADLLSGLTRLSHQASSVQTNSDEGTGTAWPLSWNITINDALLQVAQQFAQDVGDSLELRVERLQSVCQHFLSVSTSAEQTDQLSSLCCTPGLRNTVDNIELCASSGRAPFPILQPFSICVELRHATQALHAAPQTVKALAALLEVDANQSGTRLDIDIARISVLCSPQSIAVLLALSTAVQRLELEQAPASDDTQQNNQHLTVFSTVHDFNVSLLSEHSLESFAALRLQGVSLQGQSSDGEALPQLLLDLTVRESSILDALRGTVCLDSSQKDFSMPFLSVCVKKFSSGQGHLALAQVAASGLAAAVGDSFSAAHTDENCVLNEAELLSCALSLSPCRLSVTPGMARQMRAFGEGIQAAALAAGATESDSSNAITSPTAGSQILLSLVANRQTVSFASASGTLDVSFQPTATIMLSQEPYWTAFSGQVGSVDIHATKEGFPARCLLHETSFAAVGVLAAAETKQDGQGREVSSEESQSSASEYVVDGQDFLAQAEKWVNSLLHGRVLQPDTGAAACDSPEPRLWWLPPGTANAAEQFLGGTAESMKPALSDEHASWLEARFGSLLFSAAKSDLEWLHGLQAEFSAVNPAETMPAGTSHEQNSWDKKFQQILTVPIRGNISCSCPRLSLEWLLDRPLARSLQAHAMLAVSQVKIVSGLNGCDSSAGVQISGTPSLAVMSDLQSGFSTLFEAPLQVLLTARCLRSRLHFDVEATLPSISGMVNLDQLKDFCGASLYNELEPVEEQVEPHAGAILLENLTGSVLSVKPVGSSSNQHADRSYVQVKLLPGCSLELDATTPSFELVCPPPSSAAQRASCATESLVLNYPKITRPIQIGSRCEQIFSSNGPGGFGDCVTLMERRSRLADGRLLVRLLSPLKLSNQLSQPLLVHVVDLDGRILWAANLGSHQSSSLPSDIAAALASSEFGYGIKLKARLLTGDSKPFDFEIRSKYLVSASTADWGVMDSHRKLTTIGLALENDQASSGILMSRSIPASLVGRKFIRGLLDKESADSRVQAARSPHFPVQQARCPGIESGFGVAQHPVDTLLSFKGGLFSIGRLAWPQMDQLDVFSSTLALSSPLALSNISHLHLQVQATIWESQGSSSIVDVPLPSMMQADVLPSGAWQNSVELMLRMPGADSGASFVVGGAATAGHASLPCTGSLIGSKIVSGVQLFLEVDNGDDGFEVIGVHCVRSAYGGVVCSLFTPVQWQTTVPPSIRSTKPCLKRPSRFFDAATVDPLVSVSVRRTHNIQKANSLVADRLTLTPDGSQQGEADGTAWVSDNAPSGCFLPLDCSRVGSQDLFEWVPTDWFGNCSDLQKASAQLQREAQSTLRADLLGNQSRVWKSTVTLQIGRASWLPCTISVGLAELLQHEPHTLEWLNNTQSEIPLSVVISPAFSFSNNLGAVIQVAQEGTHPQNWVSVLPGESWPVLVLGDDAAIANIDPLSSHSETRSWFDHCKRGDFFSVFDAAVFSELDERQELGLLLSDDDEVTADYTAEHVCAPATERAPVQPLFRVRLIDGSTASSWSGAFPMSAGGTVLSCSRRTAMVSPWLKSTSSIIHSATRRTLDASFIASPSVFFRLDGQEALSSGTCIQLNPVALNDTDVIEISNSSSLTLIVKQRGVSSEADRQELLPGQGMLYSWAEPCIVPPSTGGRSWLQQRSASGDGTFWGSSSKLELEVRAVVQLPATFMQSAMTSRVLHTVEAPLARIQRGEIKDCAVAIGGVSQQSLRLETKPTASGRFAVVVTDARRPGSEPNDSISSEVEWIQPPASDARELEGLFRHGDFTWSARLSVDKLRLRTSSSGLLASLEAGNIVAGMASGIPAWSRQAPTTGQQQQQQQYHDEVQFRVGGLHAAVENGGSQLLCVDIGSNAVDVTLRLSLEEQRQNVWVINEAHASLGNIAVDVDVLSLAQQLAAVTAAVLRSQGSLSSNLARLTSDGAASSLVSPSQLNVQKFRRMLTLPAWKLLVLAGCLLPDCWQIGIDLLLLAAEQPPLPKVKQRSSSSLTVRAVYIKPLSVLLSADRVLETVLSNRVGGVLPSVRDLRLTSAGFKGRGLFLTPASANIETGLYFKDLLSTVSNLASAVTAVSFGILPPLPPRNTMLRTACESPLVLLPVRLTAAIVASLVYSPVRSMSVILGLLQLGVVTSPSVPSSSSDQTVSLQPCSKANLVKSLVTSSIHFTASSFVVPLALLRSLLDAVAQRSASALSKSLSMATD